MDVYYAQEIAKYVQNPEVGVRIRPNFEARRNALTCLSLASYAKTLILSQNNNNNNNEVRRQ